MAKNKENLVCEVKELASIKKLVVETADAEIEAAGASIDYEVGTMIEIPRAALTADEIAKEADFFCFGTNDLTQMTFGFSRDDAGKFLNSYYDTKIFENDPFAKLDQNGVGKLMEMALKLGKPVNPSLHVGICGEHGGDPASVEFCHKIGLDYVSCSPFSQILSKKLNGIFIRHRFPEKISLYHIALESFKYFKLLSCFNAFSYYLHIFKMSKFYGMSYYFHTTLVIYLVNESFVKLKHIKGQYIKACQG